MPKPPKDRYQDAKRVFRRHGGIMRTQEALQAGIHPRILYEMRDEGLLDRLARGLYRLADLPPLGNPDLVPVARRIPGGVVCLISALAFHEMTTQVPHEIYVALERGAEPPRLEHPPLRVFWFTGAAFQEGIEKHEVDNVTIQVYSPEKTVADCFKYRNKIGMDTALEALRLYRQRKKPKTDELLHYAAICRVRRVIQPYVEALW
jgi:predicted transcriptional regulator of viral defense system